MLLFSTILDINGNLTKESFIRLVIDWNRQSTYENNIIPDLSWDGKYSCRFGTDDLWLAVEEYKPKNIIAVRFEKHEEDGSIWDTDYVMNFNLMKMCIRLDRSYKEDALKMNPKFSTPHFITMLEQKRCLQNDKDLPVTREPVYINESNISLIANIINGTSDYRLPIVFISKKFTGEDPVDVRLISSRLKGVAHVLVQETTELGYELRNQCSSQNEFDGAIGIYFPHGIEAHKRYLSHTNEGCDSFMMEKVVRTVIQYCNSNLIEPLFTWQGVNNAILMDRVTQNLKERTAADDARRKAEKEMQDLLNSLDEEEKLIKKLAAEEAQAAANKILDEFDNELQYMKKRIEELAKSNEVLQYENQGLKSKLDIVNDIPVLHMGDEFEFYPGEIKDLILLVLSESVSGSQEKTRRSDVVKDIIRSNDYQRTSEHRAEEVKKLLKSYNGMTAPLRKALEEIGFVITEDGKHYKLTYCGDDRYQIIFSKTPSDFRTGKNSSQKLNKMVF